VGQIKGAGITGPNLQKNLSGNFDIGTTNLNLQIGSVESPLLKTVVRVVMILPELRRNPNAAVGTLVGSLLGTSSTGASASPGWLDEFTKSPIDVIEARAVIAKGRTDLQRAFVQSPAFQAEARGTIELAPVTTNSALQIPLSISLRRSLAEKINFVPAGTPTNLTFVKLPDYVTLRGTLGEPKTDINKVALLGTALEQIGSSIPGMDQKTGNLLQGLGGLLTGRRAAETNTATQAPKVTTNTPTVTTNSGTPLLNQLFRPQSSTGTNAPAAPPQQRTNQNPVGGLLNQLLGPGTK
jgi:hypothetical protein